jgi:[ribosomal protein S5]-alanine N-acetyltransferase
MVETSRLTIIPLSYDQLTLYLQGENKFENSLQLINTGRTVAENVKNMVELITLPKMKKAINDYYLFYTFWIVIEKISKTIVAELGFKGAPDKAGEIEIGYGTFPDHCNKNFMTEAVDGMIKWAKQRPDVHFILVETDKENIASIKIVQKNNFQLFDTKGKMLWWRIEVK